MKPTYVLLYLLALSIFGFAIMGVDKWKAKKNRWRVPERTLFLVALLGGALGATIGMHCFHHKTKHWYFKYGLPALVMLQAALLGAYLYWYTLIRM